MTSSGVGGGVASSVLGEVQGGASVRRVAYWGGTRFWADVFRRGVVRMSFDFSHGAIGMVSGFEERCGGSGPGAE